MHKVVGVILLVLALVAVSPEPAVGAPTWESGDVHIHTKEYSHDAAATAFWGQGGRAATIAETSSAYELAGYDWMFITDHSDVLHRGRTQPIQDLSASTWADYIGDINTADGATELTRVLPGTELTVGFENGGNPTLATKETAGHFLTLAPQDCIEPFMTFDPLTLGLTKYIDPFITWPSGVALLVPGQHVRRVSRWPLGSKRRHP